MPLRFCGGIELSIATRPPSVCSGLAEDLTRVPVRAFWAEFQPDGRRSEDLDELAFSAARHGKPQQLIWRHKRFDGVEFDTEMGITPLVLRGRLHHIVCLHDITHRQRAENQIRELNTLQQAILMVPITASSPPTTKASSIPLTVRQSACWAIAPAR